MRVELNHLRGMLLLIAATMLSAWGISRPVTRVTHRLPRRLVLEQRQFPAEPIDDSSTDLDRPHALVAKSDLAERPRIAVAPHSTLPAPRAAQRRRMWRRKIPPPSSDDLPASS